MKPSQTKFIKQYASEVVDFSSQYGGENPRSVSYSVANIVGEPRIFPAYGDFTQAAVFRTYGPWWSNSSTVRRTSIRPRSEIHSGRDYVDLLFEEQVYPRSIAIYETFNPGAVVRILALTQQDNGHGMMVGSRFPHEEEQPKSKAPSSDYAKWEILWECDCHEHNFQTGTESRMFAPVLRELKRSTRYIRLEFCSEHLEYYTELDAVELTGTAIQCLSSSVDPPISAFRALSLSNNNQSDESETYTSHEHHYNSHFDTLPLEVLRYIFSFLPLLDLCRCSAVCKLFHQLSYDSSQFIDIDLKGCWHLISDEALSDISSRCTSRSNDDTHEGQVAVIGPQVQVLDLSWCGGGGILSKHFLSKFIRDCGSEFLSQIVLASSPAVTDEVLLSIAQYCPNLIHLDVQSCLLVTSGGFDVLKNLTNVQNLNFYRTKINDSSLKQIINSNPNITDLNIGSCTKILDYDDIFFELSQCCLDLSTIDCWRAKSITSAGLEALCRNCCQLTELDLGWCGGLQSTTGCFETLARHAPHLTKLYATANRTISDLDINALADNCPKLEKLDILGTRLVSLSSMTNLLLACQNLQFLDVSFCFAFTTEVVESLKQQFPHVAIKRSFQDENTTSS